MGVWKGKWEDFSPDYLFMIITVVCRKENKRKEKALSLAKSFELIYKWQCRNERDSTPNIKAKKSCIELNTPSPKAQRNHWALWTVIIYWTFQIFRSFNSNKIYQNIFMKIWYILHQKLLNCGPIQIFVFYYCTLQSTIRYNFFFVTVKNGSLG